MTKHSKDLTREEIDAKEMRHLQFILDNPEKFRSYYCDERKKWINPVYEAEERLIYEFGYQSPRHPNCADRIVGLAEKYS